MRKLLIVYYSHSGNTRTCASIIASLTQATRLELLPTKPYPADLWQTVDAFKAEMASQTFPELAGFTLDLVDYDIIFVGTPNWGNTLASPLRSFFNQHDFSGKTIVPFISHGGGGEGNCVADMARYSRAANTLQPLVFSGGSIMSEQVTIWLEQNGLCD